MKIPYAGLTVLGVVTALASSMYLAQTPRPYEMVAIKFCPSTANNFTIDEYQIAQQDLNRKYCIYEHKMLNEVWEQKQYEASRPLPADSFKTRIIPKIDPGLQWLVVAPIASGLALMCWQKKSENDEVSAHLRLESYKSTIKLTTVSSQGEREFKTLQTNRAWDKQKVKHGFVSVEAIQDKLKRQTEVTDKTHSTVLSEYDAMIADLRRKRAESLRDEAKADSEREKIQKTVQDTSSVTEGVKLKNDLINALKNHEDGWLWKIIDNLTPLWLIGRMGSGKTYTAASIALVRKYCLDTPVFYLIDRHATGANQKAWQYIEAANRAEREDQIGKAFITLCDRWLTRIKEEPKVGEQVLVDEYTNLKNLIGEPAETFYNLHTSDTRKALVQVIGVTHNDTNAAYPEGSEATRKAGTILIQKFSANGKSPLSRVKITRGLFDDDGNELLEAERTLPEWFNPESLWNHFNGSPIKEFT